MKSWGTPDSLDIGGKCVPRLLTARIMITIMYMLRRGSANKLRRCRSQAMAWVGSAGPLRYPTFADGFVPAVETS
eukprot:3843561-Pyramimonas_sp.AAC.1